MKTIIVDGERIFTEGQKWFANGKGYQSWQAAFCALIKNREEMEELYQCAWDRQIELDVATLGPEELKRRLSSQLTP
jgi:hypothetical protein